MEDSLYYLFYYMLVVCLFSYQYRFMYKSFKFHARHSNAFHTKLVGHPYISLFPSQTACIYIRRHFSGEQDIWSLVIQDHTRARQHPYHGYSEHVLWWRVCDGVRDGAI